MKNAETKRTDDTKNQTVTFKEGQQHMNSYMKKLVGAGLMAVGLGLIGRNAHAANPDAMQISVTPSVTYAVTITSVNASGYQFGTVALNSTTQSTAAITVANSGNVAEYFSMAVTNTSGNWAASASAPTTDNFRLIGLFNATEPASSSFQTSDALTNSTPGAAATLYGHASTKTNPSANQKLWLRLEMPQSLNTGTTGAQTMTLTVTGQAS